MVLPRIRSDLRQLRALVAVVRRHNPHIRVVVPIRIRCPIARKRQLRPVRRPRRPRIVKIPARHLRHLLARQIKHMQMCPPVIQIPNLIRLKLQSVDYPRLRRLLFLLDFFPARFLFLAILRRLQLLSRSITHHQTQPLPIGDHTSESTACGSSVNCVASPPNRFSSQTCVVPPLRADKNAKNFPSGLHSGCPERNSFRGQRNRISARERHHPNPLLILILAQRSRRHRIRHPLPLRRNPRPLHPPYRKLILQRHRPQPAPLCAWRLRCDRPPPQIIATQRHTDPPSHHHHHPVPAIASQIAGFRSTSPNPSLCRRPHNGCWVPHPHFHDRSEPRFFSRSQPPELQETRRLTHAGRRPALGPTSAINPRASRPTSRKQTAKSSTRPHCKNFPLNTHYFLAPHHKTCILQSRTGQETPRAPASL